MCVTQTHLTSQIAAHSVSSAHLHHRRRWQPGENVSLIASVGICANASSPTGAKCAKDMQQLWCKATLGRGDEQFVMLHLVI